MRSSASEGADAATALHHLLASQISPRDADRILGALRPCGEPGLAAALALAELARAARYGALDALPRQLLLFADLTPSQRQCVQAVVPGAPYPSLTDWPLATCVRLIETFGRYPQLDGRLCLALLAPGAGPEEAIARAADLVAAPHVSWRELTALRRRLRRLGLTPLLGPAHAGSSRMAWAPLLRAEAELGRGAWAALERLLLRARAAAAAVGATPPGLAWLSACAAAALDLAPRSLATAVAAVGVAADAPQCLPRAEHVAEALRLWAQVPRPSCLILAPRLGMRPDAARLRAWASLPAPAREALWSTYPAADSDQITVIGSLPSAQIARVAERCCQVAATIGCDTPYGTSGRTYAAHLRHLASLSPEAWHRGHGRAASFFATTACTHAAFVGVAIALTPPSAPVPSARVARLLHALPGGDICAQLAAWQRLPPARSESALRAVHDLLMPWKGVRTYVGSGSDLTDIDEDFEDLDQEPPIAAEALLTLVADQLAGSDAAT